MTPKQSCDECKLHSGVEARLDRAEDNYKLLWEKYEDIMKGFNWRFNLLLLGLAFKIVFDISIR